MKEIKPKLPSLNILIRNMSSNAYHGTEGTYSSSQLKDLIDDEDVFIRKYVKRDIEKLETEAFDTGNYFHTGLLEPHKLSKEVAVYPGKVRSGKNWIDFKLKHKGKLIITSKQKEVGDSMIKAVKNSPVSCEYLKGEPELSLFVELLVADREIYAPYFGKVLTTHGWESVKKVPKNGFKIVVKVRADCLGPNFISDLKSTSGKATQSSSVRGSISKYKYDLSAALYLDLFSLVKENVSAFIWIFASKDNSCAASWIASPNQILVGRAKWSWAVKKLADLSAADWQLPDYLREAEPLPNEMEWMRVKETDLL